MFHWIIIHFLIHFLSFKNFAVCCSFSITCALNTAATAWMKFVVSCLFIFAKKVSLSKINYVRVHLYSNDRRVGFSSPSVSFFFKKKVKDCIIIFGSEKGHRLLSYVCPQRKYTPYGKTFYQILWGCINVKATHSCSSEPVKKKWEKKKI